MATNDRQLPKVVVEGHENSVLLKRGGKDCLIAGVFSPARAPIDIVSAFDKVIDNPS